MSNHSLYGYLSRRTTQQLLEVFYHHLQLDICDHNAQILRDTLSVLCDRTEDMEYIGLETLISLYEKRYPTPD